MGEVLESNLACIDQTNCGSSDAMSYYLDESGKYSYHCFSCKKSFPDKVIDTVTTDHYNDHQNTIGKSTGDSTVSELSSLSNNKTEDSIKELLTFPVRELTSRGISLKTAEKYQVRVGVDTRDGITPTHYLFPVYKEDSLSGFIKKGVNPKSYQCIGDCKGQLELFGLHCVPKKSKSIYITEGYEDCLSLYQILKSQSNIEWEPAVVSLPMGAGTAVQAITNNLESLSGYGQIVLVFDQDDPGKKAAKDVCKALAGKIYTVSYSLKDANEMLLAGRGEELKWAVLTGAKKYQPDGILNAKDCWKRYKEVSEQECYPYPSSMPLLNELTYGCKPGTIVTITGGTSVGKTQFLRELKYHYYNTTEEKIADIALEEDIGDTIGGLLSLHLNKRITLPDVQVKVEDEKSAFDDMFTSGRFTLYDYFGGMDDNNLFSKLRYFAATGHKFIFLDHLSIIVSEYASEGGERERIDTIMTKLAKFVKETGTIIFLVVHLKKATNSFGKTFEEGLIPTLDDLRGSSTIKQLSWDVIGLARNLQHEDSLMSKVVSMYTLKCRFTGRTGYSGSLIFNEETGRLEFIDNPLK